jgi:mannose-6-phosphate isomerase-like protein (cupin superfamily)
MRLTVPDALAQLPGPTGERYATVLEHGTLQVEIYAPRGTDPQQPHSRDELYFVAQGRGTLFCEGRRVPVAPGDCLFVPAGEVHRFEDFSDDLVVWVVFYGPEEGEVQKA